MKPIGIKAALVMALLVSGCATTKTKSEQGELVTLPPITHTYYWETYVLSKDAPLTANGRYRLAKVNADGTVELTYFLSPERTQAVVVKPKIQDPPPGPVETFYVTESNAQAQTATLRELLMK